MNDRAIRTLAVTIALVSFVIAKFYETSLPASLRFLMPGTMPNTQADTLLELLLAAWSGIKVGLLIVVMEFFLYRYFARRFIGRWAYRSSSGNFAVADIRPTGWTSGGIVLSYSVSLYKTASEVCAVLHGRGASVPFGTAEGLLLGFKDDKLTIVYQVSVGSDPYDARKGILTLNRTATKEVLSGVWESTKINTSGTTDDKKVRVGDLSLYRPRSFKEQFCGVPAQGLGTAERDASG